MPARIGQPAPDFSLAAHTGETVRLSDARGRPVVVFFFPKAFTPVCTKEACHFRDAIADDTGTVFSLGGPAQANSTPVVLGISSDSVDTLRSFADRHRLPFLLLSDPSGRVRAEWDVPRTFGVFPGRVTYVLDRNLIVLDLINAPLRASAHVKRAATSLKALNLPNSG